MRASLCCGLLLLVAASARADFSDAPQTPQLLAELRDQHGFSTAQLAQVRAALREARLLPQLIHTEQNAKERTLSWDDYAPIHINPTNIANGVKFMQTQRSWLKQAEDEYGVPAAVITAVLGVETKYGQFTGRVRVLDALATMGFDHPTRGPFFLSELEQFFVLCRDDDLQPTQPEGSYAGAMGAAQFMPSNYLKLGVDFDHDGSVDLWSAPDAIGSIANYLVNYAPDRGWDRGMPLMVPATVPAKLSADVTVNGKRPTATVAALRDDGVIPRRPLPGDLHAGLVRLDGHDGPQDWIALHNFYAVMTYNPRIFYAMAVAQLAQALTAAQAQGQRPQDTAAR